MRFIRDVRGRSAEGRILLSEGRTPEKPGIDDRQQRRPASQTDSLPAAGCGMISSDSI